MSGLAFWTRAAILVLILVPPVIFVLFLRDAVRLMRELGAARAPRPAAADPDLADPRSDVRRDGS